MLVTIFPKPNSQCDENTAKFQLKDVEMLQVKSGMHLSMTRCASVEDNIIENIDENIRKQQELSIV